MEKFLRLIRKFLNAGYMENNQYHKTYSGAVQGGIISPILANIYLDQFDKYMKEYKEKFDKGNKRTTLKSYTKMGDKRHRIVKKSQRRQMSLNAKSSYLRSKHMMKSTTPCQEQTLWTRPLEESNTPATPTTSL